MRQNTVCGRKWVAAVVLFALLLAGCDAPLPEDIETSSSVSGPAEKGPPPAISAVGDIVEFGRDRWIVLELLDDRALLITENPTTIPYNYPTGGGEVNPSWPYDYGGGRPITWEECTLRYHLNAFYIEWFSPEEQARILKTTVKNDDNPEYGTEGGNDTEDYFFLLSIEEAQRYFPDDASRQEYNLDGEPMRWWLRSPGKPKYFENYETSIAVGTEGVAWEETTLNGYINNTAAVVEETGEILVQGTYVGDWYGVRDNVLTFDGPIVNGGVRPVFWLDITP